MKHRIMFFINFQYIKIKFTDIEHFYNEIWNFLIHQKYIDLYAQVIDFLGTVYTVKFDIWLRKDVLELEQVFSKDLQYTMMKREAIELQQDFKETMYRKEMQKYAKESFYILCELLSIKKPIEAILKPIEQTKLFDEMILMKYKSKPLHVRMYLRKNMRIPKLLTEKYPQYYQQSFEKTKVTQDNLEKLSNLILEDSQSQQEDNSDSISNQEKIIRYYKQVQQKDSPSILGINEDKSKQFALAKQPKLLRTLMFPYQLQGLQWMLFKEKLIEEIDLYKDGIILQSDRRLSKMWSQIVLPEGHELYLNEFSGQITEECVYFEESKGGIVADQMGLGKTIMSIGLILSFLEMQQHTVEPEVRKHVKGEMGKGRTLLVVQLSVMNHWVGEFERHTIPHSVQLYEYYTAQSREQKNLKLDVYDVVITTYGVLSRDYNKGGKLFQYKWDRVILDEAHIIKGTKFIIILARSWHFMLQSSLQFKYRMQMVLDRNSLIELLG